MMRVLVTGGAGYIGSFVVRRLIERGHEVRVLDSLRTGRSQAIRDVPLEVGDIRDGDAVERAVRGFAPQAVIHLAGLKSVKESVRQPDLYYDVNVTGTATLLSTCMAAGVERFVFSSSCAVYGTPRSCPVDENAPTDPGSPYGETKLVGERMLRWHALASGMRYASLRYFNVAGAAADATLGEFLHADTSTLVPLAIEAARRGVAAEVYGDDYPTPDGSALRDYIHVEDLAQAHVLVLERLTSPDLDGAYNLGTGRPTSVFELLEEVERQAGRRLERSPRARRAGDAAVSWADPTLARSTFGWSADRDLAEIVRSAWCWHDQAAEPAAGVRT